MGSSVTKDSEVALHCSNASQAPKRMILHWCKFEGGLASGWTVGERWSHSPILMRLEMFFFSPCRNAWSWTTGQRVGARHRNTLVRIWWTVLAWNFQKMLFRPVCERTTKTNAGIAQHRLMARVNVQQCARSQIWNKLACPMPIFSIDHFHNEWDDCVPCCSALKASATHNAAGAPQTLTASKSRGASRHHPRPGNASSKCFNWPSSARTHSSRPQHMLTMAIVRNQKKRAGLTNAGWWNDAWRQRDKKNHGKKTHIDENNKNGTKKSRWQTGRKKKKKKKKKKKRTRGENKNAQRPKKTNPNWKKKTCNWNRNNAILLFLACAASPTSAASSALT